MVEFLANESGPDLVAQLQSSIRAGTRRTDTGVTHAAMDVQRIPYLSSTPLKSRVYLKRTTFSKELDTMRERHTERTVVGDGRNAMTDT